MKKSETTKLIAKLMTVYPSFKFGTNIFTGEENTLVEVVNVWHEMLGDMDYSDADAALNICIKQCKFVPTVADIREQYENIVEDRLREQAAIKNEYDHCRSYYPGSGPLDYGWPEFQERLKKAKPNRMVDAARYLSNKIVSYVHECEKNGENPKDLAECIRTIEV